MQHREEWTFELNETWRDVGARARLANEAAAEVGDRLSADGPEAELDLILVDGRVREPLGHGQSYPAE